MVDVSTSKKLEDWLKTQPASVSAVFAVRIALRVGPLVRERPAILVPFCRATLISAVANKWQTGEMNAALDAARAARAASHAATLDAAHNAVLDAAHAADANFVEEGGGEEALKERPLWPGENPWLVQTDNFLSHLSALPGGGFWRHWYEGVLSGQQVNWEMQRDIALIDPAIWDSGGDALSAAIEEIEARYNRRAIAAEVLRRQSTILIEKAVSARLTSEGLAAQLEAAITSYMAEAKANQLPEEFAPLGALPATLRRLAAAAPAARADRAHVAALEAEIERLVEEVAALTAKLEAAEGRGSIFKDAFLAQAGKSLGDWKLYAALIGGVTFLGGQAAVGATLERLAEVLMRALPSGGAPPP